MVIEDGEEMLREGETRGRHVLVVSSVTEPGAVEGIDQLYYQNVYPDSVVVYGPYPIRDPDLANLALMHDGDLNCASQRVVEHFEGAQREQGPTP